MNNETRYLYSKCGLCGDQFILMCRDNNLTWLIAQINMVTEVKHHHDDCVRKVYVRKNNVSSY